MRFVLILPPDIAKLFQKEMERLDRKKLPLARYIVTKYFEGHEKVGKAEAPKKQESESPAADFSLWQLMGRRAMDRVPRPLT